MTEILTAELQNQDEQRPAADAWTAPAVGPLAWRARSDLEKRWHSYARQASYFVADYLALANAITRTGIDSVGATSILAELAGWTCPAATSGAALVRAESDTDVLMRLRLLRGGFGVGVSSRSSAAEPSRTDEMVDWLHRESGLTWDQLARMLGVSRRSVHAWVNGQRVSGRNLERLSKVYFAVRRIEATSSETRRQAIFAPRHDGQPNLFDQLVINARKAPLTRDEHAVHRRLGIAPSD